MVLGTTRSAEKENMMTAAYTEHKAPYSYTPGYAETQGLVDQPTFRAIPEFEGVHDIWPRGDRLEAVRQAARKYRERFIQQGTVLGVRSFNIAAAPYPARFAFQGYSVNLNPFISIINRMIIIQYQDFNGVERTLVWEPTVPTSSKNSPSTTNSRALAPSGAGRNYWPSTTTTPMKSCPCWA